MDKILTCNCCGEDLDVDTAPDGTEHFYCTNDREGEVCDELDNRYTYKELAEIYLTEVESLGKRLNKANSEAYGLKNQLEWLKRDIESKTFKGRIKAIISWYHKTRQDWIYSHCKHNPQTFVSNGGNSWETTCTKCGMLIDED